LPFGSPPGYPPLYWEIRRQSYTALARLLKRQGPPPSVGPVADLGAGFGWLAYRLAKAGYRTLAVDVSLDDAFGLGAARPYVKASRGRLLLLQGDLAHPPLRSGRWSIILFGASLHHADDLEGSLQRAARALLPGGCLFILDAPIAHQPVPGTGRGDRHLGREELEQALLRADLQPYWCSVPRGPRWWLHQLKSLLKQQPLFSFPIVWAERR
jgi:SAM-dependent methyltransferase